jgi:N-acetylglutamate synthase-like GNAT family acetyltransferase
MQLVWARLVRRSEVMHETASGTIRYATAHDVPELTRLISTSATHARQDIDAWFDRGQLVVLDLGDDTLGAVIHVDMGCDRAVMDLCVVDPALRETDAEERISGVAHAICAAYGCDHLDTMAEPFFA